jgi:hypothetical protein
MLPQQQRQARRSVHSLSGYDRISAGFRIKKKTVVVSLKRLDAKMN